MTLRKKILPWTLMAVYIAAVLVLCFGRFSSIPGIKPSYFGIPADKCVHFLMFAPFSILTYLCLDIKKGSLLKTIFTALAITLAGCILGALCEWGQSLTGYRTGSMADLSADFLGLVSGSLALIIADRCKNGQDNSDRSTQMQENEDNEGKTKKTITT